MTETTGTKHDHQKPDFSLVSPIALTYLAQVLSFGAKKYASHNWRKGISTDRINAAILRHAMPLLTGDYFDKETGLPHAAHLMCECMFMLELPYEPSHTYTQEQQDLLAALLAGEIS